MSVPAPGSQRGQCSRPNGGEARLRSFFARVQSLEAAFRQRVFDVNGRVIEDASGSVVMQKPGRFRWNYKEPFQRVIVSNGEKIWLYEADLEQVTVRRFTPSLGATPAALLTGKAEVLEQFRVGKVWQEEGLSLVQLVPKSAAADFLW